MEGKFCALKRRLSAKRTEDAFLPSFLCLCRILIADAGVQNLADVPQVRDLLRGGQTFLGGLR